MLLRMEMKSISSGWRPISFAKKFVLKGYLLIRERNYSTVFSEMFTKEEPAIFDFLSFFLSSRYFFLLKNLIIMLVNSLLSLMK